MHWGEALGLNGNGLSQICIFIDVLRTTHEKLDSIGKSAMLTWKRRTFKLQAGSPKGGLVGPGLRPLGREGYVQSGDKINTQLPRKSGLLYSVSHISRLISGITTRPKPTPAASQNFVKVQTRAFPSSSTISPRQSRPNQHHGITHGNRRRYGRRRLLGKTFPRLSTLNTID